MTMKQDFSRELAPELREKMKKNLVYIGIFSIIMLFAGFTSAYIVSMGDSFWLKYPMPTAFWISTTVIIISSLSIELAIRKAQKNNQTQIKLFVSSTLLLGILFVYFQFKGYDQLIGRGIYPANNHIIVTEGRYGDYFELKINHSFLEVDGNNFLLNGKKISDSQLEQLKKFMSQFLKPSRNKSIIIKNYGKNYILYFKNQPLGLINGQLSTPNGKELQYVDQLRLRDLAVNLSSGRGDFFTEGQIGKDFHIYFKGKELTYKDRTLYYKGKKLSKYLQSKAMETADTASSYLYVITFIHLLHILISLIYLFKLTIHSFLGRYNSSDHLSLRLGAIFWHFLGVLWVYLLLFLLFIH